MSLGDNAFSRYYCVTVEGWSSVLGNIKGRKLTGFQSEWLKGTPRAFACITWQFSLLSIFNGGNTHLNNLTCAFLI